MRDALASFSFSFPRGGGGVGNLFNKTSLLFPCGLRARLKCVVVVGCGVGLGSIAVYGTAWPQNRLTDTDADEGGGNDQIFEILREEKLLTLSFGYLTG